MIDDLLNRRFKEIEAKVRTAQQQAAREVVSRIRRRTAKSQSVTGGGFVPLSKDYARRVRRSRFIGGTLTRALRIDRTRLGYKIRVRSTPTSKGNSAARVGPWIHHGAPNRRTAKGTPNPLPARPWFGVSDKQRREIRARLRTEILNIPGQRLIVKIGER